MKHSALFLLLLLVIASCTTDKKPRIVYTENGEAVELAKDTSLILMADLPILIDSTDFLVHPIGELHFYESRDKIFSSYSKSGGMNFSVSNYNDYTFSGNLKNLKFEQLGSNKLVSLTDKNIRINSARFLYELYSTTGSKLFMYQIIDTDTNKDGKLDQNDIEAIYMSSIDGSNFKKLTAANQELIDWNIINTLHRLYYKTMEDTNKDGAFDKNDKLHYYYISLVDPTLLVTEYFPI